MYAWLPRMYIEGDGKPAWGLKFLPLHTRTKYGRVVLDVPYVSGVSNKADVAVETRRARGEPRSAQRRGR